MVVVGNDAMGPFLNTESNLFGKVIENRGKMD